MTPLAPPDPVLARLARDVSRAANWYAEQDAAVAAMVRERDADALRAWDRDALARIGRETDDDGGDGEDYADGVMTALERLADELDESEEVRS